MPVSYVHHHDPIQSTTISGFVASLASSLISKAITTTMNAPLNFIQNRFQVMGQMKKNGDISQNYKSYSDCIVRAAKQQQGVKSLWKGNLAKIIMTTTGMLFSLTAGQYGKRHVAELSRNPSTQNGLLHHDTLHSKYLGNVAGMISSLCSIMITYPFQYAYIRLLTDKSSALEKGSGKRFIGISHVLSQTFKGDGVRGLYRGLLTSFGGIAIYRVSYFGLYDIWKTHIASPDSINSIMQSFVAGYFITLIASAFAYPSNTIRKRMMMRSLQPQKYSWSGQCFIYVVRNQGFMSLYRGYPISILTAISGSFMLMAYDNFISGINISSTN